MNKEIWDMRKLGGLHSQYKQRISVVALVWGLAVISFLVLGCAEGSSGSSSGGGRGALTPTLASVSNVQIQPVSNDGVLLLRWETPSDATHVIVTAKSITPSIVPAQSIQVHIPSIEYYALFQQNKPYTLKGLYATTDYTVSIEVRKSDTEVLPKVTRTVTTLTDETAPKDTFTQIAVEKASSGIKITWDKALLLSGKTDIAEATIQVIESTTSVVLAEESIQNIQQGELTLPQVPTLAGISYDIAVVYKDSNNNTSTQQQVISGIQASQLSQAVVPLNENVLKVEAKNRAKNVADESLLITWGSFNFTENTGKSLKVRIIATATNTLITEETVSKDSTATLSAATAQNKEYATVYVAKDGIALTKLYGTYTYRGEVYVYENGKYSSVVAKTQATTDTTIKPVTEVSAVGGATSIVVGWKAPDVRDYAGVSIVVKEKGNGKDSTTPAQTVQISDRAVRNTQIKGLKATTDYTIEVQSQDYTGNKGTKATATITTAKDSISPDAVSAIQVSYPFISPTKVGAQITWTAPDGKQSKNQDIKEYSVSIEEKTTKTTVLSEKKVLYPTTALSVEDLQQGKTYTITILTLDYAGNKSTTATKDITVPQPTAPSEDLFQNKPALDKTGAIQIKASFKAAPGAGKYYTLRMYDNTTLVAEKSITGTDTTITFGIADGIEVPKTEATKKDYSFTFLQVENTIVSPITSLSDTVAVYDSVSTAPPAPENILFMVAMATPATDTVHYEFSAGTITNANKSPSGAKLTQAHIQYKVYIAEGDHKQDDNKQTIDAIKALGGIHTQELAGNSALKGSFIGKKEAMYTIAIEAINSLNLYAKTETIQVIELTSKAVAPNQSLLTGKLAVSQSTSTAGTIKLVLTELDTFTDAKNYDGTAITKNTQLVYTVYGIQKDTTPPVAEVLAGRKIALGSVNGGAYTVPALASLGISTDTAPSIAIKGVTQYHFVVEVAIKSDPSKKVASSSVATVTTASQATAPADITNIQTAVVKTGITVSWTAPSLSTSHRKNTGDTLTIAEVSYKIYSVAKSGSTQRTVAQIKKTDASPQTVAARTTSTILTGLTVGTSYEIVVQSVNSTDTTKASTGVRKEFDIPFSIGNSTIVSAEVGKSPAIHTTRILTSTPSGTAFTCDAKILEADSKKIKQETGLEISFEKSTSTVTIQGTSNKSNIHDTNITNYSYDVIQCSGTTGIYRGVKIPATITVQTGLKAAPSGEAADYYRPEEKSELKAIITAEKGASRQNTNSPNLNMIDTSAIDDMSDLFDDDKAFNGDITQWNTSNVETMQSMFSGAYVFNQDIGSWNVKKVTNMNNMFENAHAFNQDIGNWNVSSVTDMESMFLAALAFNKDIGNWNVGNVVNKTFIFLSARMFDQDLSSWKLCKSKTSISDSDFGGSAMAGKKAQYPKDSTDTTACPSS